ncbi:Hypothetical Protein FCC1311_058952 [Hondaea fermentalgiana]|uniref:Uncharacterized protein n=1 Tax=Hondaea fermentalgiana TaxID=2315210 RepID=A0A2R5GP72_9STRA|nr:Hypothetical Protein FCC1311_058952 [Hondaea fermentalgiana]|eukprot:GBG29674.1 Hypothetical Protein FCC1311_058952 [Hondaea fermentalgiana]
MQRAQPFQQQLERDSPALQQSVRNPLKSFSHEERMLESVQAKEVENEDLKREVIVLQRRLAQEQTEHAKTRANLGAIEAACRRLHVHRQVEQDLEEHARQNLQREMGCETEGPNPNLLSQKPRDIRVHGGAGLPNKFAFGSDELQQLIEQHNTSHAGSFSRRSSFGQATREEEAAAARDRETSRKEHWRRMTSLKRPVQEKQKFDIFGNAIVERAPSMGENNNQTEDAGHEGGLFAGLGTARARHERAGTDLQSDAFLATAGLWRGGLAAHGSAPGPSAH